MKNSKIYLLKEDWKQSLTSTYYVVGFTYSKDFAKLWILANENIREYEEVEEILECTS